MIMIDLGHRLYRRLAFKIALDEARISVG